MLLCSALYLTIKDDTTQQTMSETQIREAAEELGMIDNPVLSQLTTETNKEQTEAESTATTEEQTTEQNADKQEQTTEQTVATEETMEKENSTEKENSMEKENSKEDASSEESATQVVSSSKKEQESKAADNGQKEQDTSSTSITIEVKKGEGSDTVSKKLEEAGLVPNAKEFDKYLMANGYDKKITAGTHQIPAGADKEEIAKSLCR